MLAQTKFVLYHVYNLSMGKPPFEIDHTSIPRLTFDLEMLPLL